MVVIEPVAPPKPEPQPLTTADAPPPVSGGDEATAAGYASDGGYETASETEVVSDGEENGENRAGTDEREELLHQSNEDELEQKSIEQANDAKLEGNKLFVDGQYEEALSQYELALQLGSEIPASAELQSICHSNRATCYFKLGKYEDTIKECTKALELNPTYMKALLRRGEGHQKLEHYEEAIADLKKVLELDPSNNQARRTVIRLEPLAAEKREKMKEEMLGKLKEMGNSILGRFGMSTDNFKAVKDPNTGSYSISFQR
ncbi:hypothetical protein RJ639_026835 [Escallonia herrerae]|uniref:Tetratricopeptide repeat protein 1 n=1 Tax=Escallonia herrerae TaxID=1293975 RepID=A0AA89BHB8_9ASTE|nr:hypothetical protein RJ639_026835 [Escallonia herrerae]